MSGCVDIVATEDRGLKPRPGDVECGQEYPPLGRSWVPRWGDRREGETGQVLRGGGGGVNQTDLVSLHAFGWRFYRAVEVGWSSFEHSKSNGRLIY
jgi:hypothetical protein